MTKKKVFLVGFVALSIIGGVSNYLKNSNDEKQAELLGFENVSDYRSAVIIGFDTSASYYADVAERAAERRQRDAEREKIANERGFDSVSAMVSAELEGFTTKVAYDEFLAAEERTKIAEAEAATRMAELAAAEANEKAAEVNARTLLLQKATELGFETVEEMQASDANARALLIQQATERGFATIEAMEEAEARGFKSAEAEQNAADVGASTKDEYENFLNREKEQEYRAFIQRLLDADYYGFINTKMTKNFDYDEYAGKSCTSVVEALLATPSNSGDFMVIGTYVFNTSTQPASGVSMIIEPKNDCDEFFGFSCDSYNINNFLEYISVGDEQLVKLVETGEDEQVIFDYTNVASGYIDYEFHRSQKNSEILNADRTETGRDLICIEN